MGHGRRGQKGTQARRPRKGYRSLGESSSFLKAMDLMAQVNSNRMFMTGREVWGWGLISALHPQGKNKGWHLAQIYFPSNQVPLLESKS